MAARDRASALQVLVVGTDEHYRERAQAVIGELGNVTFAAVQPADPRARRRARAARAGRRRRARRDGCEAAAASVVAALATAAPRLGVVVVCEHLTHAARDLGALPKWGWMRDLRVAVQHAQIDGSPLVQRPTERLLAGRRDLRGVAPGSIARR